MHWSSHIDGTQGRSRLPDLLAEYGRLAAQLPDADPSHAKRLHERLRKLDTVIDAYVAEIGTSRL